MSKVLKDAMPVGSKWTAFHHVRNMELGERTVKGHRSKDMIFVNHAKDNGDAYLTYPKKDNIRVTADTVIIMDDNDATRALLTYTRVK